jgi:7-cyano-7-deazaguanine synthase
MGTLSSLAGFEPELGRLSGRPVLFGADRLIGAAMTEPAGNPAVLLLSGGLDSMVAGGIAREAVFDLLALTVDYGQRHRVELKAAEAIAARLGALRHIVLPLDLTAFGGSALTADVAVPKTGLTADIPVTYVPARNTIMLSLCLGWAEAADARDLFIGVNALDYSGYPDCRPEFVAAFETLANLATKAGVEGDRFTIHAPLQHLTKADIVREAARLGLDPALSWSCYDPVPGPESAPWLHCGRCDSCRLRARGFAEAGVPDPTLYAESPGA